MTTSLSIKSALIPSVFTILVGLAGAIAPLAPAFAQTPGSQSGITQGQSELLITEPVAITQSVTKQKNASLDAQKLGNVANSIQAQPGKKNADDSVISDNLIPKDLFRVPSKPLSDSHPLEVFQPPAPNRSFGINLNRL